MRSLKRNKQKMYYSTYSNSIPVYQLDENGKLMYTDIGGGVLKPIETGETIAGYSLPVKFKANISASKGDASQELFGINLDYTKTISTTDMSLPISETSRIWLETVPRFNDDGTVDIDSADYSVAQVARSLNSIMYAVKKLQNG